ncbi:MAG: 16S rRNA (cytosine(1402)-N(4))-methyltransferase RsmH [Candidatus Riflebacteria bacterium]|nr:16S rRNA (cytosine(1402)-N(4))-methyltransferase RsmH [Candidatus Riflebacteria bacterium]
MATDNYNHIPVLAQEFLELGFPSSGMVFVDATFGLGGHSKLLLEKFPGIRKIVAIDRDSEILKSPLSYRHSKIETFHAEASMIRDVLDKLELKGSDGILLDLGVSSPQIDDAHRGFSFSSDGPLDMRMDRTTVKTAADLVNTLNEEKLANIIYNYGEEKFSRRIASKIVYLRQNKKFETTLELANAVISAMPPAAKNNSRIHPATRVFMALRIAVNDELSEVENAVESAIKCLNPGGRLSVISFHSLEDRIVKNIFIRASGKCLCPPGLPECRCGNTAIVKILTKKPLVATEEEEKFNPRSRSAKLRIVEKL